MHEQAKAIVKQAHVRARRGAAAGEMRGWRTCLAMIGVLDESGMDEINFAFVGLCGLFVRCVVVIKC